MELNRHKLYFYVENYQLRNFDKSYENIGLNLKKIHSLNYVYSITLPLVQKHFDADQIIVNGQDKRAIQHQFCVYL